MSFEKVTKDSINGVIGILNSIEPDRTAEVLEKGKPAMVGEIRTWSDGKYRKTATGWEPVKDGGNKSNVETSISSSDSTKPGDIYADLSPEKRLLVKEAKPSSQEEINRAEVILTFANQKLLNLWENEISGQISDGMWENSRNTDWLWKNSATRLGDTTKVEVTNQYTVGKKSFPLNGELKSIIGERATEEAGFKDMKEMSQAWAEISNAISNVSENKEQRQVRENALQQDRIRKEKAIAAIKIDLQEKGFTHVYDWKSKLSLGTIGEKEISLEVDPKSLTEDKKVKTSISFYGKKNILKEGVYISVDKLIDYGNSVRQFISTIQDY